VVRFATEYFHFETKSRRELVRITDEVARVVEKSGIREGMVLVSAMHITAGVFVNDDEPGLFEDIWEWLQRLAPEGPDYRHHRTGEDNGDAHLKSLLVHHQAIVPITSGKLDLGPWQQIFYAEFDGQRRKRLVVKAMGE
jgi:secondary thiamine-phosphate synthase enzyme